MQIALHVINCKIAATVYIYIYTQGVTGGRDKTSGECSLCYNIPI